MIAAPTRMIAINCEMVETTTNQGGGGGSGYRSSKKQSELARLSVVDVQVSR